MDFQYRFLDTDEDLPIDKTLFTAVCNVAADPVLFCFSIFDLPLFLEATDWFREDSGENSFSCTLSIYFPFSIFSNIATAAVTVTVTAAAMGVVASTATVVVAGAAVASTDIGGGVGGGLGGGGGGLGRGGASPLGLKQFPMATQKDPAIIKILPTVNNLDTISNKWDGEWYPVPEIDNKTGPRSWPDLPRGSYRGSPSGPRSPLRNPLRIKNMRMISRCWDSKGLNAMLGAGKDILGESTFGDFGVMTRSLKTAEVINRKRLKIIQVTLVRASETLVRGSGFPKSQIRSSPIPENICKAHQRFFPSMANNTNSSYLSIGSQSKPPTLIREEFQQWKIQMINFLEGIHPRITEFLHNPPYIPIKLIPRVPAIATTAKSLNTINQSCKVIGMMKTKRWLALLPNARGY
ncbi:hypothetical protein OSB04_030974 [Centaurea solstitialis]|uniref:Uncharacterized protein n=1 Tax=Centaurea solstitialis TaxID=347529 RepID=A0AA38SKU2_9ASTR|nr:hypothetical protein OSB04_030974 [Centaurea solstitialis]